MEFIIWVVHFTMGIFLSIVTIFLPMENLESRTITVFYSQVVANVLCVWLFRKYLDIKGIQKKLPLKEGLLFVFIGIGLCWGHRIFFLLFPEIGLDLYKQMGVEWIINTSRLMYTSVPVIIYTTVLAPLTEEILIRNVCLNAALRKGHKGYAIFITAFLFAISHRNAVQFLSAFIMGLLIGYLVLLTKDFRAAVLIHMANNTWSVLQGYFMMDIYEENLQTIDSFALIYGLPILGILILGCSTGRICYIYKRKRNCRF